MSGWFERSDYGRWLRLVAASSLPFLAAACASDGSRYAPPPPWSNAQQQYNQASSQRPPVAGQSNGWAPHPAPVWNPQSAPAWQPQTSDVTGSIAPPQIATAPIATPALTPRAVYAKPLPPVATLSYPAGAPISAPRVAQPTAQWTPPPSPPPQWTQPAPTKLAAVAVPLRQANVVDSGRAVTVESSQSLAGIARKHGVKTEELMQLNGISDADAIVIGQRLKLPKGAQPAVPLAWTQPAANPPVARPTYHTVRAGETLTSIAAQYGVEPTTLARANHFGPSDRPQIGQKLALSVSSANQTLAQRPQTADPTPTAVIAPRPPEAKVAITEPRKSVTAQAAPAALPPPAASSQTTGSEDKLDFRWPVRGRVVADFGPQSNGGTIDGIKIAVPQGTPVRAAEDGTVAYAGSELKPYGNLILIRHEGGFVTAYGHNSDVAVKNGETVKRGQIIGRAGQTGNVSQPQVHFEIRKGKTAVDPKEYLRGS